MELTIIIVSFNTKNLTIDSLHSIFSGDSTTSFEIIVVDNGSTDGSVEAIQQMISVKSKRLIRLVRNKQNLGFAKAVNQGVRIAGGKYLLLLNSDTKVRKGAIDGLLRFAKSRGDAGVVGPRLINTDGSIQPSCYNFPSITLTFRQYLLKEKGLLDKFAPKGKSVAEVDAVVGGALLITPEARIRVQGFDERYFMYFEDLDYCRKIFQAGLKVYYLPTAEIVHHHGESGKEIADEENQWRRLVPSSKIYHGVIGHYIINSIIWASQKIAKFLKTDK